MLRQMIVIDSEKCNGCGNCVSGCAEGAIAMVEGKAHVVREDFCDGLGACLPLCPTQAITFEMREAPAFVDPHTLTQTIHWPIQIQLSPLTSPAYNDAHLLISADCCAYCAPLSYHNLALGKTVLIGCPKLDRVNYAARLGAILKANTIHEITLLRMNVACCKSIQVQLEEAIHISEKTLKLNVHVLDKAGNFVK